MAGDQRVTRSSRSHSQQLVGIYHMLEVRWPSGTARALNKHIKMLLDRQEVPLVAHISYQFTVNRAQHRLQNAWITRCVRHNAALRWTPAHGNKAPNSGNAALALPDVMNLHFLPPTELAPSPQPSRRLVGQCLCGVLMQGGVCGGLHRCLPYRKLAQCH